MIRCSPMVKAFTLLVVVGWRLDPSLCQGCTSFIVDNNGYAVFGANYDDTIRPGLLFVNKRGLRKHNFGGGLPEESF